MKLIPEQLVAIKEEIEELKGKSAEGREYIKYALEEGRDNEFGTLKTRNAVDDREFAYTSQRLDELSKIVSEAEIVDTPSTDVIGIGTSFEYLDLSEDEVETYTLVEDIVGLGRHDNWRYISVNSPFGANVVGKTIGDEVSFTVGATGYHAHGRISSIGPKEKGKELVK